MGVDIMNADKYIYMLRQTADKPSSIKKYYRGAALLEMLGYDPFDIDTVQVEPEVAGVKFAYRVENNKLVTYIKFKGSDPTLAIDLESENGKPVFTVGINDDVAYMCSAHYRFRDNTKIETDAPYLKLLCKGATDFRILDDIEEKLNKLGVIADELKSLIDTHKVSDKLAEILDCSAADLNKLLEKTEKVEQADIAKEVEQAIEKEEPVAVEKDDFEEVVEEPKTKAKPISLDDDDDTDIFAEDPDDKKDNVATSASDFIVPSVNKLEENDDPFASKADNIDDDPFASM